MAFGFDPRIILDQAPADTDGMARTFADMARLGMARQQMLEQKQRQQTLRDLYATHGDNPQALGAALMKGGFAPEAYAAQDQQSQMAQQGAETNAKMIEAQRKKLELLARPLQGGLKSQDDLNRAWASWKAAGLNDFDLQGVPKEFNEQTAPMFDQMAKLGVSSEEQLKQGQWQQDFGEKVRHNKAEEAKPSGMPAMTIVPVMNSDGSAGYSLVDTRTGTPSKPAVDKEGKPLVKPPTGTGGAKGLPATEATKLADIDTAEKQVTDIFAKARAENISGLGAKANQFVTDAFGLQSTDAARFEGASAPVRQGVGTILEGGKLAAGDEAKYKNMMPKFGDSPDVLAEKEKAMKAYLASLKANRVKALKDGGYQTPGPTAPGKVTVSNGKERLVIDAADLADAKKDGFKQVTP